MLEISLLNAIDEAFRWKPDQSARKQNAAVTLTRHVELVELETGGFIADTPGIFCF